MSMWCLGVLKASRILSSATPSRLALCKQQLASPSSSLSACHGIRTFSISWGASSRQTLLPIGRLSLHACINAGKFGCLKALLGGQVPLLRSACQRYLSSSSSSSSGALHANSLAGALEWHRHTSQLYMRLMGWSFLRQLWPHLPQVSPRWLMDSQGLHTLLLAFYRHLPDLRQAHVQIISAINLAGNNLLRTFAIFVAEITRSSAASRADAFGTLYVEPASQSLMTDSAVVWWRTLPLEVLQSLLHIVRLTYLFLLFAPVILTSPLALSYDMYREEWMELLRNTLQSAGPAFIKWGQWAATRLDLFPPDMCTELEKLQTQAPDHAYKTTKKAVEKAFGMSLTEMFDQLDEEPVASGSIGQIHRAVLSKKGAAMTGGYPGQVVAVKVRHPGVAETITQDFEAMLWVAHIFNRWKALEHLRLEDTLKQFAAPLKEQVDLAREANNLQRFNYNFRNTESVRFPVPLYPLVSTDVLVETFEEGDHITSYIEAQHNLHNHKLSLLGSGTMLQMMLVDNLIHSDLHPGNILVRLEPPRGLQGLLYKGLDRIKHSEKISNITRARIDNLQQSWLQPAIVLLDVGMATELTAEDQRNMVGLFRGLAMLDGRECGYWTLRFSGRQQTCPDPEAFKEEMERAFAAVRKTVEDPPDLTLNADSTTTTSSAEGGDAASPSGQADTASSASPAEPAPTQSAPIAAPITVGSSNAETLGNVLELVRQHQVSLPGHICAAVVTTLVLEGWSNKLDPDHSVLTQVNKMFEATNLRWAERIVRYVDELMDSEDTQMVLG